MTFALLLADIIARRGLSQNQAAARLGCAGPWLNQILRGKRTPPLDRLDRWAEVMGLTARERQRFLDLAAVAHLPAEVRPRFAAILDRLEQIEALALASARPRSSPGGVPKSRRAGRRRSDATA